MARQSLRDPWQDACDTLRERILSGSLRPGERILEVPLAEELGLSRGPIREALRALVAEGLIVREPRIGSIVVPIDAEAADEVYTLRAALETFAVRRALARTDDLALQLWVPLEQMRSALRQEHLDRILEPDLRFHSAIVEAAEHRRLLRTWQGLVGPLRILIGLTARRGSAEHKASLLGHEEIYERVRAGDVEGTVASLTLHLDTARSMVLSYLGEGDGASPPRAAD